VTPGDLRAAWRLQRFELILLIGTSIALAAASLFVAWQLDGAIAELRECYRTAPDSSAPGWPCQGIDGWYATLSAAQQVLLGVATAAPFVLGIFLGGPLVAREIERRTASIAWSLSPSRRRWLIRRAVPVAGIVAVALLLVGQAAEVLIAAGEPDAIGFRHFATHGPLLMVRGLAVFGIGLFAGLVIGRMLPAVLLTGLAVVALFGGLQVARTELMRSEAVWLAPDEMSASIEMVHDSGFRVDATGEILTYDQAFERYPEELGPFGEGLPPGTTMLVRANPPEQYPIYVAREAGALLLVIVAASGAALLTVRSRRPE
jgi:hypothetical protein